jgi:hypothetical protein
MNELNLDDKAVSEFKTQIDEIHKSLITLGEIKKDE